MTSCLLLIDTMPTVCHKCQTALCMRQQVLNMAQGDLDAMLCLSCMAQDCAKEPEQVLLDVGAYILSRQCFSTEWIKYADSSACPFATTCLPDVCFTVKS
jgi:hypothetical protein